jgi:hypothetical protein
LPLAFAGQRLPKLRVETLDTQVIGKHDGESSLE